MQRPAKMRWLPSPRAGGAYENEKRAPTYLPRIVGDKVMMPADLKRLHKYMLDVEHIGIISDEMREVVEELWPQSPHSKQEKQTMMKIFSALAFAALMSWTASASAQTSFFSSGSGTIYTGNYPTPGPVPCGHYINNPCKPKATKPIKPRNARR
jgi:hypothetical protein